MVNAEVARVFEEIADLLELKGENQFKVRAYRRAAEKILGLPEGLDRLASEGRLNKIEGIGEALGRKIKEFLETGRLEYHERLKKEVPEGLLTFLAIPGVGPRTASTIHRHLGITTIDALREACERHQIRNLPGMGPKTELNILHGIELIRSRAARFPLGVAYPLAREFLDRLLRIPLVKEASLAGSLRRMKETIGDVDVVVATDDACTLMDLVSAFPYIHGIKERGPTRMRLTLAEGIDVDLWAVKPRDFVTALHHSTGSKAHNVRLRSLARERGLKINEYGVFREAQGASGNEEELPISSEEAIYQVLELSYIPPELREDSGEIEAAQRGELPNLITPSDIKGDLHLHSSWSDGVASIEEMALAAKRRGYKYIAICDHSKSLGVARGLTEERILRQLEEIRELNERDLGIRILAGIEVDIKKDGSLDLSDEVLRELDIVVASVHSAFRQDEKTMTQRVIRALENEHVDILGHPTGRLLGSREPYAIDIDRVIEVAQATGTSLEINSFPERLDLNDVNARKAREAGVKLVINTDSHSRDQLDYMHYGISVARRGWLEREDVLNAWPFEALVEWLTKRPRHARE